MFPERFNNKTNGVTPRRWLLMANPALAQLITEAIGDGWVTDLSQLRGLAPLADDAAFRERFLHAKRQAKDALCRLAQAIVRSGRRSRHDLRQPDQAHPRVQAAAAQRAAHRHALQPAAARSGARSMTPRTFFFAGKAAPAYHLAKLIIKLINNVAAHRSTTTRRRAGGCRVLFLPDYNVSLAERLIPASDVSEQISTAGYEASGTGNMKFMMNGALTVGTRDGATIEMARGSGRGQLLPVRADGRAGGRQPRLVRSRGGTTTHDPETREALDLIFSDHFSRDEPGIFDPIREALLTRGDYYMHLADLKSYAEAQERVGAAVRGSATWARKADPQRRLLRSLLQRPDDRRVRRRDLERPAVSGAIEQRLRPHLREGVQWGAVKWPISLLTMSRLKPESRARSMMLALWAMTRPRSATLRSQPCGSTAT